MESASRRYQELCDGPALPIAPGLYQLTLPLPFRLNHVHVYLVEADDGFILIDTGVNTAAAWAALQRKLQALGLDSSAIRQIVITHFHSDHCGQAARLQGLAQAPIVMGEIERLTLDQVQDNPNEEREELFRQHGLPPQEARQFAAVLPSLKHLSVPFAVDERIGAGFTLLAKHRRLEAFITPGHTPGHVCLFLPEEQLLFCGDHILQKITPNIGWHSYSGPDPLDDYLRSLQATLQLGARRLLPAHGPLVEEPEQRIHELLQHHQQRLQLCLEALDSHPTTAYEVTQQVFGRGLDTVGRWMALGESLAHLEHLVHQGLAAKTGEQGCVSYTTT